MTAPSLPEALFEPSFLDDPYPLLDWLRRESPVHALGDTGFHLVSTWELVQEAVARTDDFSSELTAVLVQQPDGSLVEVQLDGDRTFEQVLATVDDPVHKLHRSVVLATIGKRIRSLEDSIDRHVARLWHEGFGGRTVDWVERMADRLPMVITAELIGLDVADVPWLLRWAYASTELLGGLMDDRRLAEVVTSSAELHSYLSRSFAQAVQDPQDDLMGELARAVHDGDLERETAVLILVQLVAAGGESSAGLIGTAARRLACDPVLQERLRADPALVDPFLDECLRLESPFRGHYRHVLRDTVLGGVELPRDSHLYLLWGAANRDQDHFPRADELDLDRPGIRQHLAFGRGTHFCLGSALARLEAAAAVRALLAGTTSFELDGSDAQAWVPSVFVRRHVRLRLRLT